MDIIIGLLILLAGIIALALFAALFVSRDYAIQREVVINSPVKEVFDFIRHLRNQDYFSKWVMEDPTLKKDLKGVDGTVGCVYTWDGKTGKGEQEIKAIDEGRRVDIEIRFERPFASTAQTPFNLEAISPGQTKVTWGMEGRSKYPLNLMTAMMKGVLGKDVVTSLENLKRHIEKKSSVSRAPSAG